MGKEKNYKKIDKKAIDAEFLRRFQGSGDSRDSPADPDSLANFVRDSYFPLLYAYAGRILESMAGTFRYEDAVSSLAIDVMEEIISSIRRGTLGFNGSSAFSSYLFSAVKLKRLEKSKIYYPSEVQRHGPAATHAYRLLLIERLGTVEVERILRSRYELGDAAVVEIMALVGSYEFDEIQRRRDRDEFDEDSSVELLREESPYHLPHNKSSGLGDYIRKSEVDTLYSALSRLEEPAASIIRGYMLEGRWANLKEMEEELGLKNGSYELKKAKSRLRELVEETERSRARRKSVME